ncbi:MerR family transcriptional regulator, partial [Bifidobacteriaceae bacterium NR003]
KTEGNKKISGKSASKSNSKSSITKTSLNKHSSWNLVQETWG